ncbi:SDR family NAD(P)-dependent oxidoreductase [Noviherbaspirillum sedimenti]|uniref:SDR family oxidoreductase n=1 Tax=Noviherbaspirillum sedimenti TaxID=2320865 RepID=A0A3A3FWR9_9BURK|nr:SDR family oxidoreductase [Noviherbaspirillum sedimenti]RJG00673.1 SDR family oxidoreductase [Noviherbaspirillum sedimenti]
MKKMDLEGQVALVTGASYGLGRAITEELIARGAAVMLTDIDPRLETTTAELKANGHRVAQASLNVLERDSIFAAVAAAVREFGRLDIFVNNAGWSKSMNFIKDITPEEWDLYMNINVRGNLFCIQAASEAMAASGRGGRYVAIASTAAVKPYKRAAAYCTSKSAIPMLVKAAALELAEHRITVNCVAPGPTTTETNLMHSSGTLDPAVGEEKRRRQALIPLGINAPEDIATAVAFFSSPAAGHVTGQMLVVEGGGQLI